MHFELKKFNELSVGELYDIYKLRSKIFVVEQNCVYQDIDDKDPLACHLMVKKENFLAAYARILPPGVSYPEPSIGRVVVDMNFRSHGSGKLLMQKAVAETLRLYQEMAIVISAQTYLEGFYTDLGFRAEGEVYSEDNIPHIKMRYSNLVKD